MIRAINALAIVVLAALAVATYIAKTEAQGAQERLAGLQAQLAEERRQINVLTVEIAHLEDPERLRALARRYLGFEPLDPAREVALSDLPLLIEPVPAPEPLRHDFHVADVPPPAPRAHPAGGRN
ncbi:MAG: hypothetical protein KIS81_09090 [Maricaulaceae bacterium]|nr:hypothetical protein [Maricaulaceae bacterium]